MKKTIEDIRIKFQNNEYMNNEHLKISLVLRILQTLGWDLWNPKEFYPDFVISPKRKVDVALFAVPSTLSVFIEIKPVEKFEQNVKEFEPQLNDFKNKNIIFFLVLTDGKNWSFYYSYINKEFSMKCFKTINIIEDEIEEIKTSFETYLSKSSIANGNAQRDAKNYLLKSIISQTVTEVIPKARQKVNEPPYPRLPQAIVQLVTQKGFKITEDEVIKILEDSVNQKLPSPEPIPALSQEKKLLNKNPKTQEIIIKEDIKGFYLLGKKYLIPSWKELLMKVCDVIYELHSNEFHKCLKLGGDKGNYFSQSINDFVGKEPLSIGNNKYYVMTNLNADEIINLVNRILVIFGYQKSDFKIIK